MAFLVSRRVGVSSRAAFIRTWGKPSITSSFMDDCRFGKLLKCSAQRLMIASFSVSSVLPSLLRTGQDDGGPNPYKLDKEVKQEITKSENMTKCYDLLNKTGRSFAFIMGFLPEQLRDALCLQYVGVRAVDTVEDDMTIPLDIKKAMLSSFNKYLQDATWKYTDSNDEYAIVLEQFPCVTLAIAELSSKFRSIVLEQVIEMGHTLVPFVGKEYITMEDINEYCGAVGGLFWVGSAQLFAVSGLGADIQDTSHIKQAGLLLQKTNIIRDFRKDWMCGRLFYPKDVWSRYVNTPGDFLKPENFDKGVECVKELVTDTLQYLIPSLRFLKTLKSPDAIKYFGIHQVVTAATLERCYNNPRVFTESVKVERGTTSEIMKTVSSLTDIVDKTGHYVNKIQERSQQTKEPSQSTLHICQKILDELELFQANKDSVISPSA